MSDNINYADPLLGNITVAADLISGVYFPRTKLTKGANNTDDGDISEANPLPVHSGNQTRADTYTATGAGTVIDVSTYFVKYFSLQVSQTGTVTSWTVTLEGSNDNSTYTTILTHSKVNDFNGGLVWMPQPVPCRYFRSNCTGISLGAGTNIIARIVGMN